MNESVRAFVAVELPPEVRAVLEGVSAELRAAGIRGLRPVRPEAVHLTLKFLGQVSSAAVDSIAAAVSAAAADVGPFRLSLGGVGVYPNKSRPRVLWVGVKGDLHSLLDLRERIDVALEPLGYPEERRRFSPHLTLGRLSDRAGRDDRQRAGETLFSAPVETGVGFTVESVSLMRSRLSPDGASYDRLGVAPLRII